MSNITKWIVVRFHYKLSMTKYLPLANKPIPLLKPMLFKHIQKKIEQTLFEQTLSMVTREGY